MLNSYVAALHDASRTGCWGEGAKHSIGHNIAHTAHVQSYTMIVIYLQ